MLKLKEDKLKMEEEEAVLREEKETSSMPKIKEISEEEAIKLQQEIEKVCQASTGITGCFEFFSFYEDFKKKSLSRSY